jgi:hypothetical protein
VYHKYGTPVSTGGLTVALRGEWGQITGWLSVNRDITERKLAEEAVQQHHTDRLLDRQPHAIVPVVCAEDPMAVGVQTPFYKHTIAVSFSTSRSRIVFSLSVVRLVPGYI